MAEQALTDLRVVDISQGIAGPYATKLLADSGAAVTKVEPPAGDCPHLVGAPVSPFAASGPYPDCDRNRHAATTMSSIMYTPGDPDREPLTTGGEPAEYIAGVHLGIGILAAIANRAAHGGGDRVD